MNLFESLNERLEKFLEEDDYHENSEDVGTMDVTWVGIERGDNDEDTIFFYKDLDKNEYFYQSEELDRDGFKTLEDAIKDAKKGCEEITNREFFKMIKENNIDLVILKESSPTCGVNYIYDGTFTHTKIKGSGFLTKMLKEANIKVISNEEFYEEK